MPDYTSRELMAIAAARKINDGEIVFCGTGISMLAAMAAKAWDDQGVHVPRVAVNLSPRQFLRGALTATVVEVLEQTSLAPERLELEVTEGMLMQNPAESVDILRELKTLGVQIAIDDFGTGYSSLSYLKRFPLDSLKIDRSFVIGVPDDNDSAAIAETVLAMLKESLRRFPTGTYMVWYPKLHSMHSRELPEKLKRLPITSWLHVSMDVHTPSEDGFGMHGSGLFIINPPWTLPATLKKVMPWLVEVLGQDEGASFKLEFEIA